MKEYFVILVNVTYNMKVSDWHYGEYDQYPSREEIEKALVHYRDKQYPTDDRATVHYAKVEKRHKLEVV